MVADKVLHGSLQSVSETRTQTKQSENLRSLISRLHCRLSKICCRENACCGQWTVLVHTEVFPHTEKSLNIRLLHIEVFYTEELLHMKSLDSRFFTQRKSHYTEQLLQTAAFTHTQTFTREVSTQRVFYTQRLLRREVFTAVLLYTDTVQHRNSYTQGLVSTDAFPQRSRVTEELLHTEL